MNQLSLPKLEEIFLALKIEKNEIKSAFWTIKDGEVVTLALGAREEWGTTKEELVIACDASVSKAVVKLPEISSKEPRGIVLALPGSWVQDSKITNERSKNLRFVTDKLGFSPLGFVVIPEAIAFYLKKEKAEFTSCILVYVGNNEITVSLLIDGKVVQSEEVGRSDNLALDVEEGILRFQGISDLPPRILLYNGEDLEQARQTIISYPWSSPNGTQKPGFLHLPRVDILPPDFDIEAVVMAGGEEIKKTQPQIEKVQILDETLTDKKSEESQIIDTPTIEFFKGKDVLEGVSFSSEVEPEVITEENLPVVEEKKLEEEKITLPESDNIVEVPFSLPKKNKFSFLSFSGFKYKRPSFSFLPFKKSFFVLILLLGIVFITTFYFLAKAQVNLIVAQDVIEKKFEFGVVSGQTEIDLEGQKIALKTYSVENNGTKTKNVTGKKTVGEKAKGEIMVYNRTDSAKTFSAGTVLQGPGKLRFVLNDEVKIASKTPDLASGVDRWGEIKTGVTAVDIGAQYNLGSGSQFLFEDFPSSAFLAKSETAFSGGTSRQIAVVSQEDESALLVELKEELTKKAKDLIKAEIGAEEEPIWNTLMISIKDKKYNHEVQEEANDLTLDLTIEARVSLIDKKAILQAAMMLSEIELKNKTEMQIEEDKSGVVFSTNPDEESKNTTLAEVKIVLKKSLDILSVRRMVTGKFISSAQRKLSGLSGVKFYEIKISPGILKIIPIMPFAWKNITVVTQVE